VRVAIEAALAGQLAAPVVVAIPCDSPTEPRWFDVLISSRFNTVDGQCIGATVTLTRSQASRKPGAGPSPGDQVPAFPDLPRLEMERLVAEVIQRSQEAFAVYERTRVEADRRRLWSGAAVVACRAILNDGGERSFRMLVRSLVEAGAGSFAFVATLQTNTVMIAAEFWAPEQDAGPPIDAAVAEAVLRGAPAMLASDASMVITPLDTADAGISAIVVGQAAANSFDADDVHLLSIVAFHVAVAVDLAPTWNGRRKSRGQ
jgi:hypothetical protein